MIDLKKEFEDLLRFYAKFGKYENMPSNWFFLTMGVSYSLGISVGATFISLGCMLMGWEI